MYINKQDFIGAAQQGQLSEEQIEKVWQALEHRQEGKPKFDLVHVAYYFGAMIVILAMSGLMTLGWEWFGGGGIFGLALIYAIGFAKAGHTLWNKDNLRIPGGLLYTLAVFMTPLAIYGLQRRLGWWPGEDPGAFQGYFQWVKGGWIPMELGTIAVTLIVIKFVRFPFLMFPLSLSLWFLSMDLTDLWTGVYPDSSWWDNRRWIALVFGLVMLIAAYSLDHSTKQDFSFWLYLFGLFALTFALSLLWEGSEYHKALYGLINVGFILISILLNRQVFIVIGSLGIFGYLSYLAYHIFEDSILFPFILSLLGIGIMYLGILYQRHRLAIENKILAYLPKKIKHYLPR
jgi:hypothetical protein